MSTASASAPASMAPTATAKVWLITGCSSGIGQALAFAALVRGDRVIATARDAAKLEALQQHGAITVALDVTWTDDAVRDVVTKAAARAGGRIDILVNNAGYALVGSAEECSADEIAAIYSTNVFGIYRMVRVVLPFMRAQHKAQSADNNSSSSSSGGGVIANIGSLGSRRAFPGSGVYCATKFAVAGLSESLRAEVAHLGIDVTCVDLASFRTSFGDNYVRAKTPSTPEDESPAAAHMKAILTARNGRQPGDPALGAAVLVEALTKTGRCVNRQLPVRLAVGSEAEAFVTNVLERDAQDVRAWRDIVSHTDHADAANSISLPA